MLVIFKRLAFTALLTATGLWTTAAMAASPIGSPRLPTSFQPELGSGELKRVTGMGSYFIITGLDLLEEVWAARQNPEPPTLCGPVMSNNGKQQVWVQDTDRDYDRRAQVVTMYFHKGKEGREELAQVVENPSIAPPKDCPGARLWEVDSEGPPFSINAEDQMGNATVYLPTEGRTTVIRDADDPEGIVFRDFDILEVQAGVDDEWLTVALTVDGDVSEGTVTPIEAHQYGIILMDPRQNDRVNYDEIDGFAAQFMPLYRLANQPPQVLIRFRNDHVKMDDQDIEAYADKHTVYFRIRRQAIRFDGSTPFRIIAYTGEVSLAPLRVVINVKDVTATGRLQIMPKQ